MQDERRKGSFGQSEKLTIVDKIGCYLSERGVKRALKEKGGSLDVLDIGCGYNAKILRGINTMILSGCGIDVCIDREVEKIPNLRTLEGTFEEVSQAFKDSEFDVVLLISVLEHLADPPTVLVECRRIMKDGGWLIINVPTWWGKRFLELSAFSLRLSPVAEMDDHKMYYDKRDLWPLLVRAGFRPSKIRVKYHKLGLNLFSVCVK